MFKVLALLVLCGVGSKDSFDTRRTHVDRIEANTFHDPLGYPAFTQIIAFKWVRGWNGGHWNVRSWFLIKSVWVKEKVSAEYSGMGLAEQKKHWSERKTKWMAEFDDLCNKYPDIYKWGDREAKYKIFDPIPGVNWPIKKSDGKWEMIYQHSDERIVITADVFTESNTQYDVERANRQIIPEDQREPINGFGKEYTDEYGDWCE